MFQSDDNITPLGIGGILLMLRGNVSAMRCIVSFWHRFRSRHTFLFPRRGQSIWVALVLGIGGISFFCGWSYLLSQIMLHAVSYPSMEERRDRIPHDHVIDDLRGGQPAGLRLHTRLHIRLCHQNFANKALTRTPASQQYDACNNQQQGKHQR